jgi:hypothetical protein
VFRTGLLKSCIIPTLGCDADEHSVIFSGHLRARAFFTCEFIEIHKKNTF